MRRLEEYVSGGGRLLRCGYTTGTCAAAATHAATELLLAGVAPPAVVVSTPAGLDVVVDIEEAEKGRCWARCAVQKDAGDDPDVTDGVMVYAKVARRAETGVLVEGGLGVGRVTKAGLDQPVGAAAINSMPRRMICEAAQSVAKAHGYEGGLTVEVSIPEGVELARRTFNPRLGIADGISVLGTTGIVRPMSEDALISSIALDLRVLRKTGARHVLVVPGNYGKAFAESRLGLDVSDAIVCSNYLGATIDEAARLGFTSMLVVGHLGKLVKVAAGVMNTHSRVADCRAEVMATHAALAGASRAVVAALMDAPTTDAMVDLIAEQGLLGQVMASVMARMAQVLAHRAGDKMRVDAVVFSQGRGVWETTRDGFPTARFNREV